jgi:hypothetical protein
MVRPQRLVVNYSYDLPLGDHKGALGKLSSGWQVAGVTVIQDGTPLTITNTAGGTVYTGGAQAGSGEGGNSTAQLCPGFTYSSMQTSGGIESRLGGAASANGFLKPAAFCAPPVVGSDGLATAYGNSGLGVLQGPGQVNFDLSAIKTTKITERQTLQFRAEFFNIFNHAQFGNPGTAQNAGPASFGVISTTSTNPRLVQFALKYLF